MPCLGVEADVNSMGMRRLVEVLYLQRQVLFEADV